MLLAPRKILAQNDLSNKGNITSYLTKSRGKVGIGCLAAHEVAPESCFFPSFRSAISDCFNLRFGIKMAAAITGMTLRCNNPFLWFSIRNEKTFLGNPPKDSPNVPLARVESCPP